MSGYSIKHQKLLDSLNWYYHVLSWHYPISLYHVISCCNRIHVSNQTSPLPPLIPPSPALQTIGRLRGSQRLVVTAMDSCKPSRSMASLHRFGGPRLVKKWMLVVVSTHQKSQPCQLAWDWLFDPNLWKTAVQWDSGTLPLLRHAWSMLAWRGWPETSNMSCWKSCGSMSTAAAKSLGSDKSEVAKTTAWKKSHHSILG